MIRVRLSAKGKLLSVSPAGIAQLGFNYEKGGAVTGVFLDGVSAVGFNYDSDGNMTGIFPGKAKDRVDVQIE